MEFKVGSIEEIQYINQIIQKKIEKNDKEQRIKRKNIEDPKEYKYLQYLIFKYCFIPNAAI